MKFCPECHGGICHFCIHYAYNGLLENPDVYCYEGFCRIDGAQRDPDGGCDNYVCFRWQELVREIQC